jgi:ElaB/YqjD/DUF883 family membrane-anchored ribosome-binding protein
MNTSLMKNATGLDQRVFEGINASKKTLIEALGDGRSTAKQILKRTSHRAEDLIDDTAHKIKRFPFQSMAVAFGLGTAFGILILANGRR